MQISSQLLRPITKDSKTANNSVLTHDKLTWFWMEWLRLYDVDNDGDQDIVTDDKFYNLQWRMTMGSYFKLTICD